jgi:hypothetical protein
MYYGTFVPRTIVQKTHTKLLVQVIICLPQLAAQPNKANKMANTKSSKAKVTETATTFATGNLTANVNAPIGLVTNNGLPVQFTAPITAMQAMAQTIMADVAKPVTTGRNVGFVTFINGWPNGQPVANMQPLTNNGELFNGQLAHSNPVCKAYVAGKPQAVNVPAFKQCNQLVKLGKKAPPNNSSNVTNAIFGQAVNAAFTASNGAPITLGALAQACANAGGSGAMPNVIPWLVQHAYGRTHWLVNA